MKRVWLSALVGLVLISKQDAMLWGGIFERDELWQYAGTYHNGWFVFLWGWMAAGFLWLYPDWKRATLHAAITYTLFFGGVPDVLYYWLSGRAIPTALPWLNEHPWIFFSPVTNTNLIVNCIIVIVFWLAVTLAIPRLRPVCRMLRLPSYSAHRT